MRKIAVVALSAFLLMNIYGCVILLVGAAGGAGTAAWLSGKLTQEVNASYERTVKACKSALKSLKLEVTKETKQADVTQIRSKYLDGKEIWIDVRPISDKVTKLEIRVGISDKQAAENILLRIQRYL